jgi:hypothetical protein
MMAPVDGPELLKRKMVISQGDVVRKKVTKSNNSSVVAHKSGDGESLHSKSNQDTSAVQRRMSINAISNARKNLSSDNLPQKRAQEDEATMNLLLDIDTTNLDNQPSIVSQAILESLQASDSETDKPLLGNTKVTYRCMVKKCDMNLDLKEVADFVNHHNSMHRGCSIAKERSLKLGIVYCSKCSKYFIVDQPCEHLRQRKIVDTTGESDFQFLYPPESLSITLTVSNGDLPIFFLESFEQTMVSLKAVLYVACLERGDVKNQLHLQAAAEIHWNREELPELVKKMKFLLGTKDYPDLMFKLTVKLFQTGQTWLGMLGYVQKWREFREYRYASIQLYINNV